MSDEELHDVRFYDGEPDFRIRVGSDVEGRDLLLAYTPSRGWLFEHTCDSPRRAFLVLCAPSLSAHTVVQEGTSVTVQPSILCPDCSIHGWVRDSVWTSA